MRVEHYEALKPILVERLRTRTRAEWIAALNAEGVPSGAVRDIAEVINDPQLAAREMIQAVEHATLGSVRALGSQSSCLTHPEPSAPPRPPSASTPIRFCVPISG